MIVKYWQSIKIYLYLSPLLKLHNQSYVQNTGIKIEPSFFSGRGGGYNLFERGVY